MKSENTYGSPLDYVREGRRLGRGPNAEYRPSELLQLATDYFEYMRGKVWYRAGVLKNGVTYELPTQCPLTFSGFRLFTGISSARWNKYKENIAYADICEWVEDHIFTQNFEGASVGAFNPGLIARYHKIADKTETDAKVRVECITGMKIVG